MYGPISVVSGGNQAISAKYFMVQNNSIGGNRISNSSLSAAVSFSSVSGDWAQKEMIIAAGDFDNDGRPEIVKAGNGKVKVHRNLMTASGTISASSFDAGTDFTVDYIPGSIVISDIDNDGKLDIITASQGGINILKNTSTGTGNINFAPKYAVTAGFGDILKVVDIDKDGKLDIVALDLHASYNMGSKALIFRNTSTSTFSFSKTEVPFSTGMAGIAVGDMDGDGDVDILASKSGTLELYLNSSTSGSVTFGNAISLGARGSEITIADLDNDGDLDIFTSGNTAWISRNDINGGTVTSSSFTHFSQSYDGSGIVLSPANINGDTLVDIIGGTGWDKYWISDNKNQPLSSTTFVHNSMGQTGPTIGIDVDGDDKVDAVCSNGNQSQFTIRQNVLAPLSLSTKELITEKTNLYPNPTSGIVTIDLSALARNVKVEVFNTLGQLIDSKNYQSIKKQNFEINAPAGIYNVVVTADGNKQNFKVIKK